MSDAGIAHVSDPVSWDELCRRFPDRWLVLVELDWTDDRGEDIRTAFVAGHGSRREAMAAARPLLTVFEKLGCFHTGQARVPAVPLFLYTTTVRGSAAVEAVEREAPELFAFA